MMLFKPTPLNKEQPILIFAFDFAPLRGGIAKYAYELTRHLHKLGYTLIVLARKAPGDQAFDENQPFRIIRMKGVSFRWFRLLPMSFYFVWTVLRHNIRLVHCINWIPCGFVARLFHLPLRCRFVVTCHGEEITRSLGIPRRLFMLSTFRKASWLIAGNNFIREGLNRFALETTPISVIGFGVDSDFFRPDLDAEFLRVKYGSRRKKMLLTVASLKKRKGVDRVLEALHRLKEKGHSQFLYIIIGDGPEKENLQTQAQQLGISEEVIFAGILSDKDLRFHYCICDCFVMVNREEPVGDIEGFGIVFIEAAAAEKVTIGGKSGGVPDSIVDGKSGFLVDPNDVDKLADKILWVAEHKNETVEMGRFARKRAISLFSWGAIANRTEMIYQNIFARPRRA